MSSRKTEIIFGIALVLIVIGASIVYISTLMNDRKLSFQMYEITSLPDGIKTTNHEITEIKASWQHFRMLRYATNNKDWTIAEQKSDAKHYAKSGFHCNKKEVSVNCEYLKSPEGQAYNIKTIYSYQVKDKSVISSQTIVWLKGNTKIWITLKGEEDSKYSAESWGSVIDSTEPVNYQGEKIKKINRVSG